ncbi:MAG: spore maturation protein [Eubacteriales bacterium]|nr:spore maturation protein [Eubacteriales bacterium]
MRLFTYLSNLIMPFFIFYIIGFGLLSRRDVYGDFLEGAEEGLKIVWRMVPTLVGLLVGVGVLRASGFLEFLAGGLGKIAQGIGFPAELMPLTIIRMFSSSAAVGLLLDIFKQHGTDSSLGIMASLILSSTESVFYCLSVYFGAVKIRKTRYAVPGALLATLSGAIASIYLARLLL